MNYQGVSSLSFADLALHKNILSPSVSNPIDLNTIINIIIAVFTAIAVIVAIVTYLKLRTPKELSWQVVSNTSVLPVVDVGEHVKGRLQFTFDGKPVNDLKLVVLKLLNSGNIPIEVKDYENNDTIKFDFGKEAELLNVEVLETTPTNLKSRAQTSLKLNLQNITLEPLLLNSKDMITFKVLLIKFKGEITVSGRIVGVKEILYISRKTFFLRDLLLFLAPMSVLLLMLFLLPIVFSNDILLDLLLLAGGIFLTVVLFTVVLFIIYPKYDEQ